MAAFLAGTLYSDAGRMETAFLGATPVPGTAVTVAGIAHKPTGERYVTDEGPDGAAGGIPVRADGAMSVELDGTPVSAVGGLGVTGDGRIAVSTDAPALWIAGKGLTPAGRLSVSEAS